MAGEMVVMLTRVPGGISECIFRYIVVCQHWWIEHATLSISAYPVIVLNECIPVSFDSLWGKYEITFSWMGYEKLAAFGKMHLICRWDKHNSTWVHNKNTSDLKFIYLAIHLCLFHSVCISSYRVSQGFVAGTWLIQTLGSKLAHTHTDTNTQTHSHTSPRIPHDLQGTGWCGATGCILSKGRGRRVKKC